MWSTITPMGVWDGTTSLAGLRESTDDEHSMRLVEARHKTEELLKIIMNNNNNMLDLPPEKNSFVHSMIELGFPNELIWISLKLRPDQAFLRDKNSGKIPLHVAAIGETTLRADYDCRERVSSMRWPVKIPTSVVEVVLMASPEKENDPSKGATAEDNKGMIPLDYLLDQEVKEAAKMVRDDCRSEADSWFRSVWFDRRSHRTTLAILALARAKPETLSRIHPRHKKILPCMMTAWIPETTKENLDPSVQTKLLERKAKLTFEVLSLNPSVARIGNRSTDNDKLKQANDEIKQLKIEKQQLANENRKLREELDQMRKSKTTNYHNGNADLTPTLDCQEEATYVTSKWK